MLKKNTEPLINSSFREKMSNGCSPMSKQKSLNYRDSPKKLNIEVKVEKVSEKLLIKSNKMRSSTHHFDEKEQGKKRVNDSRSTA